MHELTLSRHILDQIENHYQKVPKGSRVTINLMVGDLSCIHNGSLQFCFNAIKNETMAKNAVLKITRVAGMAVCRQCGASVNIKNRYDPCTLCGEFGLKITQGDEMIIKNMEIS